MRHPDSTHVLKQQTVRTFCVNSETTCRTQETHYLGSLLITARCKQIQSQHKSTEEMNATTASSLCWQQNFQQIYTSNYVKSDMFLQIQEEIMSKELLEPPASAKILNCDILESHKPCLVLKLSSGWPKKYTCHRLIVDTVT